VDVQTSVVNCLLCTSAFRNLVYIHVAWPFDQRSSPSQHLHLHRATQRYHADIRSCLELDSKSRV
jgi:hypothetical protein